MNATERRRPKKTELIQARVDEDTRQELRNRSVTEDRAESDIVRRALRLYFSAGQRLAS